MTQQPSSKPVFPREIAQYIDVAAYLLDARAPAATLYLDGSLTGKELLLLTRAGQAEAAATRRWHGYFSRAGYQTLVIDSLSGQGIPVVLDYLARLLKRKLAVARRLGLQEAVLRVVALGVPNVGKSTFLNKLIGGRRLRTGDVPGVTRGRQWVKVFDDVEVLDTPGILRDPALLRRRKPYWMLLNLMPYDETLREEAVALLLERLGPGGLRKAEQLYRAEADSLRGADWAAVLEAVAQAGGYHSRSPEGVEKAARRLLRDFQVGRLGRLTLEEPGEAAITSPFFRGQVAD